MDNKQQLRRLSTHIAYPWEVGNPMPDDVSDMGVDEALYGEQQTAIPPQNGS